MMPRLSESNFWFLIGRISAGGSLKEEDACLFSETINRMVNLLNEGDSEDCFGTQGWRYRMGWDN